MRYSVVFPGQGSQSVGMLGGLAGRDAVKQTFAEASAALGYDLWQLAQEGPAAALDATERTQPALLAAGVACWRAWREGGAPAPAYLAGHSLGEYTALVCAGALDFATAVKLVEFRGQVMQEAVPAGSGGMAAILGLDDAAVRAVCAEAGQGEVLEAVNFNAPGQVVIAGARAAVERGAELAKAKGAKRALMLNVSAPSHCALMRPAAERLAERLAETEIRSPGIEVIHNADVATHADPAAIRDALVRQLYSPVRWVETIHRLGGAGIATVVECGPGKVLAGLTRRIDKGLSALAVFDEDSINKAWAEIGEQA